MSGTQQIFRSRTPGVKAGLTRCLMTLHSQGRTGARKFRSKYVEELFTPTSATPRGTSR